MSSLKPWPAQKAHPFQRASVSPRQIFSTIYLRIARDEASHAIFASVERRFVLRFSVGE
jgi:hypothetical protein